MKQQKLETELKDAGCPYFFDTKCSASMFINNTRFQEYCLDNFKECETYKNIIKREVKN